MQIKVFFYAVTVWTMSVTTLYSAKWLDISKPISAIGGGQSDAAVIAAAENYPFISHVPGAKDNALAWYDYFEKTRGVPVENIILLRDSQVTAEGLKEAAQQASGLVKENGTL